MPPAAKTSARPALLRTLVSCALLVAGFEWAARSQGWFDPTEMPDPYQGFPGTPPLYRVETDADGAAIRARSPNKDKYRPASFAVDKPADEFRVFCIGSSSTNSDAFLSPDGSYPAFLRLYLSFLLPGKTPVVINAGGGGSSSIQHMEVLREVLDYEPDLIVLAPEAGDKNLIPPSPQGVMAQRDDSNPITRTLRRWLARSRLYVGTRELLADARPSSPSQQGLLSAFSAFFLYSVSQPFSPQTFEKLFDFKRDRVPVLMPWVIPREEIAYAHGRFSDRLTQMIGMARDADVPIIMVGPLRNLRASFYYRFHIDPSEIREGRLDEWRALYARAIEEKRAGRFERAVATFREVRALYVEDRDEILAFDLGECLEALGRFDEAFIEYSKPYRENPSLQLIVDAARAHDVPYADPFPAVCAASPNGIPGYGEFTDSVHPMANTNRIVALTVLDAMRGLQRWPELAGTDSPRFLAADGAVRAAVDKCQAPLHNRMLQAILAGRPQEAVALGKTVPVEALGTSQFVEAIYYGWALTLTGENEAARDVYLRLRRSFLRPGVAVPPLDSDEELVRVAFAGDVFAWF